MFRYFGLYLSLLKYCYLNLLIHHVLIAILVTNHVDICVVYIGFILTLYLDLITIEIK